jgi:hypothetical protein
VVATLLLFVVVGGGGGDGGGDGGVLLRYCASGLPLGGGWCGLLLLAAVWRWGERGVACVDAFHDAVVLPACGCCACLLLLIIRSCSVRTSSSAMRTWVGEGCHRWQQQPLFYAHALLLLQ